MPRIDLHVHTAASFDCASPPLEVAQRALQLGLSPLFITDHDTIEGALELRAQGYPVVVGEEITTADGELIGLYLTEPVASGQGAAETVAQIHEQGGLVYVQHPFDRRRRSIRDAALEVILGQVDIIEVYNARATLAVNEEARRLQEASGAAPGAGSDAHRLSELGRCYVELGAFSGAAELVQRLRAAKIVTQANPGALAARQKVGRWLSRGR